jgi:hypothetical protein
MLRWKNVVAFFRSWKFVQETDGLPPINRRFDLEKRKLTHQYMERVTADDQEWRELGRRLDLDRVAQVMGVTFSDGEAHDDEFPADRQSATFVSDTVRPLVVAGLWDWNMTDEELRSELDQYNAKNKNGQPDATSNSNQPDEVDPPAPAAKNNEIEASAIEKPCDHFRTAIARLREQELAKETEPTLNAAESATEAERLQLTFQDAFQSIRAVVRALNQRHAAGHLIGLLDRTAQLSVINHD